MSQERVVLYGRAGCHLCADARRMVADECARAGAGWTEVDVDTDPALRERYGELVPVVEVDGVQQGYWRIDPARVRRALDAGDGWRSRRGTAIERLRKIRRRRP